VSYCLRRDLRPGEAEFSVLDLKAYCRGYKYVRETIKMLPQKPVLSLVGRDSLRTTRYGGDSAKIRPRATTCSSIRFIKAVEGHHPKT
jgi:hypothetical protein